MITNTQTAYKDLIEATLILDLAQYAVWKEESTSPAWDILCHATNYIRRQAGELLR